METKNYDLTSSINFKNFFSRSVIGRRDVNIFIMFPKLELYNSDSLKFSINVVLDIEYVQIKTVLESLVKTDQALKKKILN